MFPSDRLQFIKTAMYQFWLFAYSFAIFDLFDYAEFVVYIFPSGIRVLAMFLVFNYRYSLFNSSSLKNYLTYIFVRVSKGISLIYRSSSYLVLSFS